MANAAFLGQFVIDLNVVTVRSFRKGNGQLQHEEFSHAIRVREGSVQKRRAQNLFVRSPAFSQVQ